MIITRSNVNVNGDACDVHARTETALAAVNMDGTRHEYPVWCGVYVRPSGPVNGYWYFPQADEAASLLVSLGAMPVGSVN
mgnify:CR=1 FL=1